MKHKKILTIIFLTIVLVIISSTYTFATIKPTDITGSDFDVDLGFIDNIEELIRTIGIFLAVGILMVIAIKYMTASIEEKANYKKSMMPYLIGCFVLFGASTLAPEIIGLFKDLGEDTETIGNRILGIIQMVGTLIAVGVVMILGIKYMMGSVEEKAEYKKNMVPYVIGAILLFAAVNVTTAIYDIMTGASLVEETDDNGENKPTSSNLRAAYKTAEARGTLDGQALAYDGDFDNYQKELQKAQEAYDKAYKNDPNSLEAARTEGYLEGLKEGWNEFNNPRF